MTILVVGAGGQTTTVVSWSRCLLAPLPGQASNPDCVDNRQAPYLEPIGEGATITTTMPADITAEALGQPDASGGVYLTLVARVTVAGRRWPPSTGCACRRRATSTSTRTRP